MFFRRKGKGYGDYESVPLMTRGRYATAFSTWRTLGIIVVVSGAVVAVTWFLHVVKGGM